MNPILEKLEEMAARREALTPGPWVRISDWSIETRNPNDFVTEHEILEKALRIALKFIRDCEANIEREGIAGMLAAANRTEIEALLEKKKK